MAFSKIKPMELFIKASFFQYLYIMTEISQARSCDVHSPRLFRPCCLSDIISFHYPWLRMHLKVKSLLSKKRKKDQSHTKLWDIFFLRLWVWLVGISWGNCQNMNE